MFFSVTELTVNFNKIKKFENNSFVIFFWILTLMHWENNVLFTLCVNACFIRIRVFRSPVFRGNQKILSLYIGKFWNRVYIGHMLLCAYFGEQMTVWKRYICVKRSHSLYRPIHIDRNLKRGQILVCRQIRKLARRFVVLIIREILMTTYICDPDDRSC